MDVSVIIVSYNVKYFLERAILSLLKALKGLRHEIFVVDNHSTDGSPELIRNRFPALKLIANSENVGFGRANNQALRLCGGDYILLINPDTMVQEDTVSKMMSFFEGHPVAGMVGCKILNPDGGLQLACRRSFPTPMVGFAKIVGLSDLFPKSHLWGRYNLTYLDENQISEVDAISGSFMMIRRQVYEGVGGFDEDFFMYGEDLDWCYRIKKAGWKIYYVPTTAIIHYKGESARASRLDTQRLFYQAMHQFVRKHFRSRYSFAANGLISVGIGIRAGLSFLRRALGLLGIPGFDLALTVLALVLAIELRFGTLIYTTGYLLVVGVYSLVWMVCFVYFGLYGRRRSSVRFSALASLSGSLINSAWTFFFKQYAYSRLVVIYAGLFSLVLIPGWRLLLVLAKRTPIGHRYLRHKTLVVGTDDLGRRIVGQLAHDRSNIYEVVGFIDCDGRNRGQMFAGHEVLGGLDELDRVAREEGAEEIIFSTQSLSYEDILRTVAQSGKKGLNFKIIPARFDPESEDGHPLPFLSVEYRVKRGLLKSIKQIKNLVLNR
ncbi:glycosyltransferase [candidate division KSB1 bacterium]|nr:glycosyltransferase [candidate division KSB1 bacterium]